MADEKAEKTENKPKKAKKFAARKPKRSCPKCGAGTSLAEHANRYACGKCGYMELKAKQ
ncbi:MAG: 30S ribosomal protein S27ae [Candidatus Micrarchaeota archaeon]